MKGWSIFLISCLLLIAIFVSQTSFSKSIYAANNQYQDEQFRQHHEKDSPLKEAGGVLGWGAVIAAGGAVIVMPLRRNSKKIIKHFPNIKSVLMSALKFFSKSHKMIGIIALLLVIIHGAFMLLDEWEFKFDVVLGIIAVVLMGIASIFGIKLNKNKGSQSFRSIHSKLFITAILLTAIHIIIS